MKNIALKKGVALVLTGPQGCGKSSLAKEIAKQYGTYAVENTRKIGHAFGLSLALFGRPETLILEGWPSNDREMQQIKSLLSSEVTVCYHKSQASQSVKSPLLIICSDYQGKLPIYPHDRRFFVMNLGPRA